MSEVAEKVYVRPTAVDRAEAANVLPGLAGQVAAATRGVRVTSKSEMEQQLLDDVAEMHQTAADIGIRPATVVNLWPVDLHSTGPHVQHHIVPACPIGEAYKLYVIQSYGTDIADKGGRFDPKVVLPITMAKDILQQHDKSNTIIQHGVAIYMGDHVPNKENLAVINATRERMIAHMRKRVDEANQAYVRGGKKAAQISDVDRVIVEYLTFHGYMTDKMRPGWMVTSRNKEEIQVKCKACGTEPEKGSFQCAKCGWIIDPAVAYEAGAISLTEDDGSPNVAGVRTLSRLPREQLEAMGISHHIHRTDEERRVAEQKKPVKK